MIYARDIMSENVIAIRPDMLIRQVAHLLLRDRVSGFPVVDAAGQIIGMFSMRELFTMIYRYTQDHQIEEFYQKLPEFQELSVSAVMSHDVVTISPETSLHQILHILIERNVFTFPVIDAGKMIGIVSRHDILNAVFSFDPVS